MGFSKLKVLRVCGRKWGVENTTHNICLFKSQIKKWKIISFLGRDVLEIKSTL